jgi:hypothetical protein
MYTHNNRVIVIFLTLPNGKCLFIRASTVLMAKKYDKVTLLDYILKNIQFQCGRFRPFYADVCSEYVAVAVPPSYSIILQNLRK